MSEPRNYWVGLPVGITVHDDGRVEYEIDTAEAGSAIFENTESMVDVPSEEQMEIDQKLIEEFNAKGLTCPRHGGPWGEDGTCPRCTKVVRVVATISDDEVVIARDPSDPGPMPDEED